MIIKTDKNDISTTNAKHIAFAISAEGYGNSVIATRFINRYWPELTNCGELEIGTVLSKHIGNKTFHALVCYTLENGWEDNQAEFIKECFDKIPANGDIIATYLFGSDFIDIENGADSRNILRGMNESSQKVKLHSDLSMKNIIRLCASSDSRKKYIVTKVEKVQKYVNTDVLSLAVNAFAIGVGTLGCLYFGNELQEYYNSSDFFNSQNAFNVRLQDFNFVISALPVFKGILGSIKDFKSLHINLNLKKNYKQVLKTIDKESWTR